MTSVVDASKIKFAQIFQKIKKVDKLFEVLLILMKISSTNKRRKSMKIIWLIHVCFLLNDNSKLVSRLV